MIGRCPQKPPAKTASFGPTVSDGKDRTIQRPRGGGGPDTGVAKLGKKTPRTVPKNHATDEINAAIQFPNSKFRLHAPIPYYPEIPFSAVGEECGAGFLSGRRVKAD